MNQARFDPQGLRDRVGSASPHRLLAREAEQEVY